MMPVRRDCVHSDGWHVGTPKNGKPHSVPLPVAVDEAIRPLTVGRGQTRRERARHPADARALVCGHDTGHVR